MACRRRPSGRDEQPDLSLDGIAVGDARHAAELTTSERPPNGAEEVPVMIDRLLAAHETIIDKVRVAIDKTESSMKPTGPTWVDWSG